MFRKKVFYLNVNHKHFNFENCFSLKKNDIPDIKVSHALNNQFDASGKRHLRGAMETTKECTCDINSECVQTSHDFLCQCVVVVVNRLLLRTTVIICTHYQLAS